MEEYTIGSGTGLALLPTSFAEVTTSLDITAPPSASVTSTVPVICISRTVFPQSISGTPTGCGISRNDVQLKVFRILSSLISKISLPLSAFCFSDKLLLVISSLMTKR